jgi:hypothetical protein
MTTRPDEPADTTMMGVVHDALRRDLARLGSALSGSPPPGPAQRRALAGHIGRMMDFLMHRRTSEAMCDSHGTWTERRRRWVCGQGSTGRSWATMRAER